MFSDDDSFDNEKENPLAFENEQDNQYLLANESILDIS